MITSILKVSLLSFSLPLSPKYVNYNYPLNSPQNVLVSSTFVAVLNLLSGICFSLPLWLVGFFRSLFFLYWPIFFFKIFIGVLFHEHSRYIGQQEKGEAISLTPHYHFHPLRIHLDISRAITVDSWLLHIASNPTWTRDLWFPSPSH